MTLGTIELRHRAFQLLRRQRREQCDATETFQNLQAEFVEASEESCRHALREARVLESTAIDIVYEEPDLEKRREEARGLLERLVPGFKPEDYQAALERGVEEFWR